MKLDFNEVLRACNDVVGIEKNAGIFGSKPPAPAVKDTYGLSPKQYDDYTKLPLEQQKDFAEKYLKHSGQTLPIKPNLSESVNFPSGEVQDKVHDLLKKPEYMNMSPLERLKALRQAHGMPAEGVSVDRFNKMLDPERQKMLQRFEGRNVGFQQSEPAPPGSGGFIDRVVNKPVEAAQEAAEGASEKAKDVTQKAKDVYEGAKREFQDWMTPAPMREAMKAVEGVKQFYSDNIAPTISNLSKSFGGLGAPVMAIGGLMLMSHLMGGRRRRDDEEGGGGRNININIGGQGMQNPLAAPGVNSLSSYKLGQEKNADVVTNALSNALKARLTNSVIDKVLIPQQQEDQAQKPKVDDKAVEIVSKYPEMQELLKDEKNKQYLEKLLQE